ncbi:MAG: non-canonical purine NTP pyrophosphatase [Candidatus Aphodocola sp.]
MQQILFATGNQAKVKRFSAKLSKKGIEILTLMDLGIYLDVVEDGKDAIANALIKARAYYRETGMIVIAMDDNLYIEGIPEEKQPGMYVRRVNGKKLNDNEMIEYYSKLASKYGKNGKLICRWIYGMALIKDGKEYTYTWQKNDFYLVDQPSNIINPGYPLNTISVNKKLNKYFTDLTEKDKQTIQEDESDVIEFITRNVLN